MSAISDIGDKRARVYRRLIGRNRLVAVMRWVVPGGGILVFAALMTQIYVGSLANQYGISSISFDRSGITVETPQYAGVMPDGSRYLVQAGSAKAATLDSPDVDLVDAALTLDRPDGSRMTATAPVAKMNTKSQEVTVSGVAYVTYSNGTTGTMTDAYVDWPNQAMNSTGRSIFNMSDGTVIDAKGGVAFDAASSIWKFSRATVTLKAQ